MLRIAGAIIIIAVSVGAGYIMCDNFKKRLRSVSALAGFVDHVSVNIQIYKTPLEEIYSTVTDKYLAEQGFTAKLENGVYEAAMDSGLLCGDEEEEIIKSFSEKIGGGSVEDMVKLCSFTSARLRNIEEKLRRDLPDKQRVYSTISVLAGVSVVIMLI